MNTELNIYFADKSILCYSAKNDLFTAVGSLANHMLRDCSKFSNESPERLEFVYEIIKKVDNLVLNTLVTEDENDCNCDKCNNCKNKEINDETRYFF